MRVPCFQINPQHSVPTLDDNGAVFWDSHAICTYLISKYGSNDALYPRDFVERAKVDQRLHFDTGVLYPASRAANVAIFGGAAEVPQPLLDNITAAYDTTEQLLQGNDYLVGNNLTVADLCCVASVSSLNIHVQVDAVKYPNISAWLNRLSKLPYYNELNDKPVKAFQAFIAQKKTANK